VRPTPERPLSPCVINTVSQRPAASAAAALRIAALLAAAYGPGHDDAARLARLRLIATHLNETNLALAKITAVHLRLEEIGEDGIARVIRTEALLKANFDPAQPRDDHDRWTAEGGNSADRETGATGHPALQPAQEVLPFLARPPFFLEDPPKTVRPFKKPIPRLSGREGAKNIPSWARGSRPYVGENGRNFARRLMDENMALVIGDRRNRNIGNCRNMVIAISVIPQQL
jgi:hypothetical protein